MYYPAFLNLGYVRRYEKIYEKKNVMVENVKFDVFEMDCYLWNI